MVVNVRPQKLWTALLFLMSASLIFLSGCSADNPAPAPASSTASTNSIAPTSSTPLTRDTAGRADLDLQWERVLGESPDAVRPVVEIVRFVDIDDWSPTMEGCMHDSGWPDVRATSDGGLQSGLVQDGQAGAHRLAMYTCNAKYPLDAKYSAPLTDERLGELYDYFADELQPCLEAEGYDTSDAPSRETFIDTYAVNGGWNLYENVAAGGSTGWDAINKKCPQAPDGFNE